MYGVPNVVEELRYLRKYPTLEKVKVIKDTLEYFILR